MNVAAVGTRSMMATVSCSGSVSTEMKDECVLGPDSTCYREACRYWDHILQTCIYCQMKEQERKKRHDDRFKDDQVQERIRIT